MNSSTSHEPLNNRLSGRDDRLGRTTSTQGAQAGSIDSSLTSRNRFGSTSRIAEDFTAGMSGRTAPAGLATQLNLVALGHISQDRGISARHSESNLLFMVATLLAELERLRSKLQRSEAYLSKTQHVSHTGSFGWKVSTGELYWSDETFRIFQYARTTKPALELVLQRTHPEDAAFVKQTFERAAQDGRALDFVQRLLMPDGYIKHVHVVGHAQTDKSGKLAEFAGAVMDVTAEKQAEDALLEERINERTRIARELHDTVLQSFLGLLLGFQTASNFLPERPLEAKQTLDRTIGQAENAITEGRDAVQGLRSSTVEINDLAFALKALGEDLAADEENGDGVESFVDVEGAPRDVLPILRDEIYRIAGEAMRNAFKHAEARRIEVSIDYGERALRVRIRDDGKGIGQDVLEKRGRSGHYGLPGMRERAELIGGCLEVWSKLHSGTEVELTVPASLAYGTSPARWRLGSFLKMPFARKTGRTSLIQILAVKDSPGV